MQIVQVLKVVLEKLSSAKITNPDHKEKLNGYQLLFDGKDYAKFVSLLSTETKRNNKA